MAQNGGIPPFANLVFQPGFLLSAGVQQPRPAFVQSDTVTLRHPRPGDDRKENVYTDSPVWAEKDCHKIPAHFSEFSQDKDPSRAQTGNDNIGQSQYSPQGLKLLGAQIPVTKQPPVITCKVGKVTNVPYDTSVSSENSHGESIICNECHKCKCESCQKPRPLPSRWICKEKYLCSADVVVDCCSCICCVKGLFYHCAKDYEQDNSVSCADDPCSCRPQCRSLRWLTLGVLSTLLPCLFCYWPMKGCIKMCEMGYDRLSSPGCRCVPRRTAKSPNMEKTPEKGLLDTSSDC
ncbi:protein sprouty homolog 3-like [Limulus polyphemus]|uniref:Protein sprouty homolog 3-like n=1 Tax=Limulus polyphemus TaxID=6850 RepID=A0ABM1B0M7_LIMPO|nr:protein sprouty homolog 3-like [Limulus polyphemus]